MASKAELMKLMKEVEKEHQKLESFATSVSHQVPKVEENHQKVVEYIEEQFAGVESNIDHRKDLVLGQVRRLSDDQGVAVAFDDTLLHRISSFGFVDDGGFELEFSEKAKVDNMLSRLASGPKVAVSPAPSRTPSPFQKSGSPGDVSGSPLGVGGKPKYKIPSDPNDDLTHTIRNSMKSYSPLRHIPTGEGFGAAVAASSTRSSKSRSRSPTPASASSHSPSPVPPTAADGVGVDGAGLDPRYIPHHHLFDHHEHEYHKVDTHKGSYPNTQVESNSRQNPFAVDDGRISPASSVLSAISIQPSASLTYEGHTKSVESVAFGPNNVLFSSGEDGTVRAWREGQSTCECLNVGAKSVPIWSVSANESYVCAASDDHTVLVWDQAQFTPQQLMRGHEDSVRCLAISDGHLLLSGSFDRHLRLWDLRKGASKRKFSGHNGWISSVHMTKDGKMAMSGSWDMTVCVWDGETGEKLHTLEEHKGAVLAVKCLHDDSNVLLTSSYDGTLKMWDLRVGPHAQKSKTMGDTWAWCLDTCEKSTTVRADFATGSNDGEVLLWDLGKFRSFHRVRAHDGGIKSLALRSQTDGVSGVVEVLTGSYDQHVKLYQIE